MNIKDILSDKTTPQPFLLDADVYSGIYKKTEKITCAVFLITDTQTDNKDNLELVNDIRRLAKDALLASSALVSASDPREVADRVPRSVGMFMSLRSMLYVLAAARGVRTDLVDVIAREVDGVVRAVLTLSRKEEPALFESIERQSAYAAPEGMKERVRSFNSLIGSAVKTKMEAGGGSGRRESILSVIKARGKVSIKDISDLVTDCSEKTIQRELMSLIEDNVIVREGERRWSKYSLLNK